MIRLSDNRHDALHEAERHNAELDQWYAQGFADKGPKPGSVSALIVRYLSDDAYTKLADRTKRDYRQHLELIRDWAGDKPTKAVTRPAVQAFRRGMADKKWRANSILRTLRVLLQFAVDEGEIDQNPAAKFRQFYTPPRQALWSHEQEERFLAMANTMGRPSMVLAYALGVYTAQRSGDVVNLAWSAYDGHALKIRQGKTKKLLEIPVFSALKALLDASPRTSTQILVSEATDKPYSEHHFRHTFARVMKEAGIEGLRYHDLRRTAVVRLAEAGATVPWITAITGHATDECEKIIETYMPRTRRMAEEAVKLMESYYRRQQ
jgi:integrase